MHWIEELARKTQTLKDEDFEGEIIESSGKFALVGAAKIKIALNMPYYSSRDLMNIVGCVNLNAIGLASRGCILVEGFSYVRAGTVIHVAVRRAAPWNHGLPTDRLGQRPYPEVDFSTLLGSPRCSRPG